MKMSIILKIIAQIERKYRICRGNKKGLCCKFKKINLFKNFWEDSEAASWSRMGNKIDLVKTSSKD